jgi:chromosome segregation ATPase
MDLQDELVRSKRVLEEKHYETSRLNDESAKKSDHNLDMRDKLVDLEKELDMLKAQRSDNWREMNRLKEVNDMKVRESADQGEKMKALDYDLSRTSQRIDDTQKMIDARNYDLRNKQILVEDAQKEIQRLKDLNGRLS